MRSRAFKVVDEFEAALCEFTGAKYAITTDSCTNALFLAFWYKRNKFDRIQIPKWTYVGVVQAAKNAGYDITFTDERWSGYYSMLNGEVVDAAKHFERDCYQRNTLMCVSFQAGKILPIGRGGAILTNSEKAYEWLRRARLDGRTPGANYYNPKFLARGWHCYLQPPDAARGLWLMTYLDDTDRANWTEYPDLSQATWN